MISIINHLAPPLLKSSVHLRHATEDCLFFHPLAIDLSSRFVLELLILYNPAKNSFHFLWLVRAFAPSCE